MNFPREIMQDVSRQTKMLELEIMANPTPEKLKAFALHFLVINAMDAFNSGLGLEETLDGALDAIPPLFEEIGLKDSQGNPTALAFAMRDRLVKYEQGLVDTPKFPDNKLQEFLDSLQIEGEE